MRILDRYLIRQTTPPFLLSLGVFTFLLAVNPMLDKAQQLLSKGVPIPTVGFLLLTLLPQALGLTIPMAFLAGLLMAFGRLSADRESVALLSCGVSPVRLLRPVLLMATVLCGATLYVMIELIPDANQKFREITYQLLVQQSETDIKPRLFYEGFPGKVLYVQTAHPAGGWSGVFLADTSQPGRPAVALAAQGDLNVDRDKRTVDLILHDVVNYVPGAEEGVYDTSRAGEERISVPPESVFGPGRLESRGITEKTIADLRRDAALKVAAGQSPHNEIMFIHQKFSFPVACLVFALLGLALGLHTRKEGRLAGFALGLGVIFLYYGLLTGAEALTKGHLFPAAWARWAPNIVLGALGILAVWWRTRSTGGDFQVAMPSWLARRGAAQPTDPPGAAARPGGESAAAPVLVLHLPRLPFPRPRLLDLYVMGQYLRQIALAFFGLMGLYYIGTVIDLSEKLFKGQADLGMLLRYLYYSTPQFVYYVVPIATLVAVLGTIGALARTSELTVMRACGVSLYRVAVPLLVLALVWSGCLFGLEERVLAQSNRKAEALEDTIRGRAPHTVNVANRNWLRGDDGRIYYYLVFQSPATILGSASAAADDSVLYGLSVFNTATSPYRLVRHTFTSRATYRDGRWMADRGWIQRFSGGRATRESFAGHDLALAPPSDFAGAQVEPDLMTFNELRDYIKRLGDSGFSVSDQRVALQRRVAFPLVTFVMTIIGVPFAVTTGRRGALYGIGLAIVLAVAYLLVSAVFLAAGSAALLPAPLAAWAANLLFLAGAVYLMLTVRT